MSALSFQAVCESAGCRLGQSTCSVKRGSPDCVKRAPGREEEAEDRGETVGRVRWREMQACTMHGHRKSHSFVSLHTADAHCFGCRSERHRNRGRTAECLCACLTYMQPQLSAAWIRWLHSCSITLHERLLCPCAYRPMVTPRRGSSEYSDESPVPGRSTQRTPVLSCLY